MAFSAVGVDLATSVTVLDACGRAGVPALLVSDPGVGKSALVRALADADGVVCKIVLGSHYEPAEVAGYPVLRADGTYGREAPSWARQLATAGTGYAFLDELTTCSAAVQGAMLSVVLERIVGDDVQLPRGVRLIAGANPADRAAGGVELEPPMANRFCHIMFAPTSDEWLDGMASGWATNPSSRAVSADTARAASAKGEVMGFIRHRPDLLHVYPDTDDATGGPWPSRRTWAMTAQVLAHVSDVDAVARDAVVSGLVGVGVGTEFLMWRAEADLPDPAVVLADPEGAFDWSGSSPDRVWAVLSAVTALAASRGTASAWRDAWGPLAVAAEHGQPDVAGAAARALGRSRPPRAVVPAAARRFEPMLRAAGLISGRGSAA